MDRYGHIAHKEGNVCYYIPRLFNYNDYYNGLEDVRMFIGDLKDQMRSSPFVCQNYYDERLSILFWKNHPLQQIHLLGCIVGLQYKWIGQQEYIFFQLDDCTSGSTSESFSDDAKFLTCKVTKDVIMSCGLKITDLAGLTLHIYGRVSLNYQELQVEYMKVCYTLTEEIEHWKMTMNTREKLNNTWSLSDSVVAELFTQEQELTPEKTRSEMAEQNFVNLGYKTPESKRNKTTFIEQLQEERIKDELEITSPYNSTNTSNSVHSLSFQFVSSLKDLPDVDFMNSSNQIENDGENSLNVVGSKSMNPPVTVSNKASAKSSMMLILSELRMKEISSFDLYQLQEVRRVVASLALFQFQQQNLGIIKSFTTLENEAFQNLIDNLVKLGLVNLSDIKNNVLDLLPLRKLFDYAQKRISVLVKLQCYTGTIELYHVQEKLHLPDITISGIIDVFKECLKQTTKQYPQTLKSWWIDLNGKGELKGQNNGILLHLEYVTNS
ncbi:Stn1p [Saccharomyces eubayanus]|uniref:Stn1p n=1 Tax=Saccharomyces eubayanus TaxID=1080349 RepID=UPI0006C4997F|nr:STN1-like protein [Saccharomyces eubayanus]KOH00936.1 STN1-like protein [Saccharomyces eubayanus]